VSLPQIELSCPYINCDISFTYPIVKNATELFTYVNFLMIIHLNHVHFTTWAPQPGKDPDGFPAQCWCGHDFENPLPFVDHKSNSDRPKRTRMLRDEVYLHMYEHKGIYAHHRAALAEQSLL